MATSGYCYKATNGDLLMAMDSRSALGTSPTAYGD
jgi:hypothetical protein